MESPSTSPRMYVKTYLEQQQLQQENNESSACPPPPLQLEESHIMREVVVFSLASHMVWCLWGLKQVGPRIPEAGVTCPRARPPPYPSPTTTSPGTSWRTTGRPRPG